ncbi:MAG TPA: SRPBCC domain-containing protein, partial [Gemmatimonadales bacterium]|nr:SRPBCC domain-containing protein [Gemmatimonadales bacterium]
WAEPKDAGDPAKVSRVTFNIESLENQKLIRLTVIHDQLEEGSKMAKDISQGWPRVLSSLKSFLETGRPLETWSK